MSVKLIIYILLHMYSMYTGIAICILFSLNENHISDFTGIKRKISMDKYWQRCRR